MSYFELLPIELDEIVLSYVILNDPNDIKKLGQYQFSQKILNNKYFWINASISNGLGEYRMYYDLMLDTEYLEAYKDILDIKKFLKKFIIYYNTYFLLPICEDTQIMELFNPKDISYFQSHINFDLIQEDYKYKGFDSEFEINADKNSNIFLGFKFYKNVRYIKFGVTKLEFITLLIKSRIFNIKIWKRPVSTLLEIMDVRDY